MRKSILVLVIVVLVAGNLQAALFGGLIAHWSLDENTSNTFVEDIGSNGHNGTATANTSVLSALGQVNSCFDFGGTDVVKIDDDPALSFGDGSNDSDSALSLAAWVYVTNHSDLQVIVGKWDGLGAKREWVLWLNSVEILEMRLYDQSNTAWIGQVSDDVLTDGWHFVCGTYNATEAASGITLYVDGVAVDSTADGEGVYVAMEDNTSKVMIGAIYSGGLRNYFQDKIDNVLLFSKCLTVTEISYLMLQAPLWPVANAGPDQTLDDSDDNGSEDVALDGSGSSDTDGTIVSWTWADDLGDTIPDGEITTATLSIGAHTITLTVTDDEGLIGTNTVTITVKPYVSEPGLVAYWPLDDNTASRVVTDISGNGNNGTVQRNTSLLSTTGLKGSALQFNPLNSDYMDTNLTYSESHKTFAFWFKSDVAKHEILFGQNYPGPDNRFYVSYDGLGNLGIGLGDSGGNNESVGYQFDTDWHFYLITWDAGVFTVHVDTILTAIKTGSTSPTSTYFLGANNMPSPWGTGNYCSGAFDEVRIFDRVLSQTEIEQLYDFSRTLPPVADANGPYTIYVDDPLTLDASGSIDPDGDIVSYMWDLEGNGSFETDAGSQAVLEVNYSYLESLDLLVNNIYTIHLKVIDNTGQSDIAETTLEIVPKPALQVVVDIKPGGCPNPLNVKSRGILPVAILGSADFDINEIDPTSIQLAGVRPLRSSYEDVTGPLSGQGIAVSVVDEKYVFNNPFPILLDRTNVDISSIAVTDSNGLIYSEDDDYAITLTEGLVTLHPTISGAIAPNILDGQFLLISYVYFIDECTTANPDGFLDLALKFKTQEILEAIGEVSNGDELMLELTGVLFGESPIEGEDTIVIKGSHKPFNKADFNKDKHVDIADFAEFANNWLQSSAVD
ncbi:LamG-like jellyroll fold domain-containing protein [Planctomycetota bacterium]